MDLLIADTFTTSLARLTNEEQKAVKTTAFDLQLNPANPGLSLHKLDKARDKRFWSARVSGDLRLILHKTEASLLLCYADHHDRAYQWAEQRKLETHPTTGAAQWVEIRETVQEIAIPRYVEGPQTPASTPTKPALFAHLTDAALLGFGVPAEWLADVRQTDEDHLLTLADHLPGEAAEALLELATGGRPQASPTRGTNPFAHPDALRRFRVMNDVEALARALEFPWDKWTIFLHPAQREWVEREYKGPARISGSAGTGKTIVALHRAVFLARSAPQSRVLLTTFSETLANALRTKLRRLIGNEPRLGERLEVHALNVIGERLYALHVGPARVVAPELIRQLLVATAQAMDGPRFTPAFLFSEWNEVVDAWQLECWEDYRDVRRLGRKTRLPENQRAALWSIFDAVRTELKDRGWITWATLFTRLAATANARAPFDAVVVDEAQDLTIAQLRFLAALGADRRDALFFAGDLGQRIFQQPFSWKALGVDIRGRSRTLHINYRTSHQIRMQADRLLGPELVDVDGNAEARCGTVSVFNGPVPDIRTFANPAAEIDAVSAWLADVRGSGVEPQ